MACFPGQVCQGTCVPGSGTGGSGGGGGGSGTGGSGGGGSGGGGGAAGIDALRGYQIIFEANCRHLARCGSLSQSSIADCVTSSLRQLAQGALSEAQLHNFTIWGTEACARSLDAKSCSSSGAPACIEALTSTLGAVQTGGACMNNSAECQSPLDSCAGATCPKTCQTVPQGGIGQPCRRATWADCESGLFCNEQDICEAQRASGAACEGPLQCQSGGCQNRACLALPGVGMPCRSTWPTCTRGSYCDSSSGLCTALKGSGAPCSADECASGLACSSGFCRMPGGVGSVCGDSSSCVEGLRCDDVLRTCQKVVSVQTGGQCADAHRCQWPEVCVGPRINPDGGVGQLGTCAVPQLGGACSHTFQCPESSFCDPSSHCAPSSVGSPCSGSEYCRTADYCGSTATCTPRFATGAQCDARHVDSCLATSDRCVAGANDPVLRCRPLAGVGSPCAGNSSCLTLLRCVNKICVAMGNVGGPCSGLCFTGACVGGTCVPPLPTGRPCTGYTECQSGICIDGTCRDAVCP